MCVKYNQITFDYILHTFKRFDPYDISGFSFQAIFSQQMYIELN